MSGSSTTTGGMLRARDVAAFAALGAAVAGPWLAAGAPVSWWLGAATIVLGVGLVVLSAIDVQTQRLPDAVTAPLIAAGLALAVLIDRSALLWHIAGAAIGYILLWSIERMYVAYRGRPGLGLGDAKLLAAAGAWLGPSGLPSVLLVATFGALAGVGVARWRGAPITAETAIPFGPFLSLGLWIVWLYGPLA